MVLAGALHVPLSDRLQQARWARGPRARALAIDLVIWFLLTFVVNSVYGVNHITSGYPLAAGSGFTFYSTSKTSIGWG